jgi:hypothetical protein
LYVTGDGYRSQGSTVLRFGLGDVQSIERVEVDWPGDQQTVLTNLPARSVHHISAPARQ